MFIIISPNVMNPYMHRRPGPALLALWISDTTLTRQGFKLGLFSDENGGQVCRDRWSWEAAGRWDARRVSRVLERKNI